MNLLIDKCLLKPEYEGQGRRKIRNERKTFKLQFYYLLFIALYHTIFYKLSDEFSNWKCLLKP